MMFWGRDDGEENYIFFAYYTEKKNFATHSDEALQGKFRKLTDQLTKNHILMKDASLNAPLTSDTVEEWQNFLVDSKQESPEDAFIQNDQKVRKKKWLTQALDSLNEREKIIINSLLNLLICLCQYILRIPY